jgi:hypothetical protein
MPTSLTNTTSELLVEDLRLSSLSSPSPSPSFSSFPSVFPVHSNKVYENSGAALLLTTIFGSCDCGCGCGCGLTCGLGFEDL